MTDDLTALVQRLRETFDPGGNLPDDCEEWASAHLEAIDAIAAVLAQPPQPSIDFGAITRLEVIDEGGRQYTRWRCTIEPSVQDQGRTLKLFIAEQSAAVLAGGVPRPQNQEEQDDQTRVAPLTAGADGQDLPRSGHEPSSSPPRGRTV